MDGQGQYSVIAEECSNNAVILCPRALRNRVQPREPSECGLVRTDCPPTIPAINGFLIEERGRGIQNDMDNLLVDMANLFQAMGALSLLVRNSAS